MKYQTNTEILERINPPESRKRQSPRADPWWERRIAYLAGGGLLAYPNEMEHLLALRATERRKTSGGKR